MTSHFIDTSLPPLYNPPQNKTNGNNEKWKKVKSRRQTRKGVKKMAGNNKV